MPIPTALVDTRCAEVIMRTCDDVLTRLRAEFMEMPGLRLTPEQVQRLCGIERTVCETILHLLVDEKFLYRTPDGQYARLTSGRYRRVAHAALPADMQAIRAS
jgi:hypothetical protein